MIKLPGDIADRVRAALEEDVGNGDLTVQLLPEDGISMASVTAKEDAVLCGCAWFDEVFRQLDPEIRIDWQRKDGHAITADQDVCRLSGRTRSLLTGERTALNFLQTLSGTATITRDFVKLVQHTNTRVLDTRKTLPGLRSAQKYAVRCGGGNNHRMGLFDAILVKENHILAAGGIREAVIQAKKQGVPVEVEVETLEELEQALDAGTDSVLLDNFSLADLRRAVGINRGRVKLEASGNVSPETLPAIAETGVDFISIGALTKNVRAIDYSMSIGQ